MAIDPNTGMEEPSFFERISGSFGTIAKWVLGIAALITGLVLFSDTARDMLDDITGGRGKGWGSSTRAFIKDSKDAVVETVTGEKSAARAATEASYTGGGASIPQKTPYETSREVDAAKMQDLKTVGGVVMAGSYGIPLVSAGTRATINAVKWPFKKIGGMFSKAPAPVVGAPAAVTTYTTPVAPAAAATGEATVAAEAAAGTAGTPAQGTPAQGAAAEANAANATSKAGTVARVEKALGMSGEAGFLGKSWAALGKAFGAIGTFFTTNKVLAPATAKVLPLLKPAAKAMRFLAPVAAGVTVYEDGFHVKKLADEGKTGSAIAQAGGTTAEAAGMFFGVVGVLVGSAIKDVTRAINYSATGELNMSRSMVGEFIGTNLGFDNAVEKFARKWHNMDELEAEGRRLDGEIKALMERSAIRRMAELKFNDAQMQEVREVVRVANENHKRDPDNYREIGVMEAVGIVTKKHPDLVQNAKEFTEAFNQRRAAEVKMAEVVRKTMKDLEMTPAQTQEVYNLVSEANRAHNKDNSKPKLPLAMALNQVVEAHPELKQKATLLAEKMQKEQKDAPGPQNIPLNVLAQAKGKTQGQTAAP